MAWHRTRIAADELVTGPRSDALDQRRVLVVGLDGDIVAIEDRCSHAGCRFSEDGEIEGDRIVCDCHGSEFDLRTGAVLRSPAVLPIATFATRVVDGVVEVEA